MRRWTRARASGPAVVVYCCLAALSGLSTGVFSLRAQSMAEHTPVRTQELLRDTIFFPEGLDADVRNAAIFVTSIATGRIIRVDSSGAVRDIFAAGSEPQSGVFGVAVDTLCECLWVTTAPHPRRAANVHARTNSARVFKEDSIAELLHVRIADGVVLRRYTLGDGGGMPGELTITPRGDVLVSDGVRGVLYRLRATGDSLETIRDSLLRSPQGIAVHADGRIAWVADWSRGLLMWNLESGQLTRVQAPGGVELRGIDGLRTHGTSLIAIQNGTTPARVLRIRTSADGARVDHVDELDVLTSGNGEPTVGAVQGDSFVYVATSQWPYWTNAGLRRGNSPLPSVQLRRLQLVAPPSF